MLGSSPSMTKVAIFKFSGYIFPTTSNNRRFLAKYFPPQGFYGGVVRQ